MNWLTAIPVYNEERHVESVVQEVRRYSPNILVINDGSTDRTGAIADEWARRDTRISVVHSVNGGLGAARNLGVRHVRGDFLAFLDSDDVLPPTAYADLLGALRDSGSDFATGSIVRWEAGELVEPPWMRRLHRPLTGRSSSRSSPTARIPVAIRPTSPAAVKPTTRGGIDD